MYRCDLAKGNPEKPFSHVELETKFLECASRIFKPAQGRRVLEALLSIENVEDINSITVLLQ